MTDNITGYEYRDPYVYIYGPHLGDVRIHISELRTYLHPSGYSECEPEEMYCVICKQHYASKQSNCISFCEKCLEEFQATVEKCVEENLTKLTANLV